MSRTPQPPAPFDFGRMQTLPALLAYHAETQPYAIALEFEGRATTYGELQRDSTAVAEVGRRGQGGDRAARGRDH